MDTIEKNPEIIKLFLTINKEFDILNFNKKTYKTSINQYQMPLKTFTNFIEMKENNVIISGRGASYYIDLFNKGNNLAEHKITDKTYRGALKINDKNVAITSNKIIPEGEDQLLFYNIKKKKCNRKKRIFIFICFWSK